MCKQTQLHAQKEINLKPNQTIHEKTLRCLLRLEIKSNGALLKQSKEPLSQQTVISNEERRLAVFRHPKATMMSLYQHLPLNFKQSCTLCPASPALRPPGPPDSTPRMSLSFLEPGSWYCVVEDKNNNTSVSYTILSRR